MPSKHQVTGSSPVGNVYGSSGAVGSKATNNDYSQIEREIERYLDADDADLPGNGTAEEACKPDLPQE